jgi:hypothetical protein
MATQLRLITKIGPTKIGPTKIGPTKTGPTKTGPTKTGHTKIGPTNTGTSTAHSTDERATVAQRAAAKGAVRSRGSLRRGPGDRRAAHWDSTWRLDRRTRAVGQAGVASAREALARAVQTATADELREAS